MTARATVLVGDALAELQKLPSASVQCCVTSPPYWGLRDYGVVGQLGLESTPDEYVQKLVAVFTEVRRVLADDGTLWLNLGDSYATGGGAVGRAPGGGDQGERFIRQGMINTQPNRMPLPGLKPKDLVGIPWRVAFALQQPQYTGTISDERDRIWLAALLDAEGCMFIHKRKAGQHNGQGYHRQNDSYSPGVEISNTSRAVVERVLALVGKGSICEQGPEQNGRRRQTLYRWNLRTTECRDFVRELYPYLIAKQQQARILIGCPSSGKQAEAAHVALIGLHNGVETTVDFPAPRPMLEPGWYLRSDIIWSKSNPMPESVTDRPTKSHEYVFLLSKSATYYYDADAISEPARYAGKVVTLGEKSLSRGQANGANVRASGNGLADEVIVAADRNARSVWTLTTKPFSEAHFATMPVALAQRCVKAGSAVGDTVLDPFAGAGTTLTAAVGLGRSAIGIELNPEYAAMARRRISTPLFDEVAS